MAKALHLNINLLPPKPRVQVAKIRILAVVLLVLGATLLSYYYLSQSREMKSQQVENMKLKSEIKIYENQIGVFKSAQAMEQAIADKSKQVAQLEKTKVPYADFMAELDKVKPPQIIFAAEEMRGSQLVVNGYSPDHSNVSRMIEGIKSSSVFNQVTLLSSNMNENTNEIQFTLELEGEADHK